MVLCLYIMTICLLGYHIFADDIVKMISLLLGIAFFWIADIIYVKTINNLKSEIRELRKEIENK